MVVQFREGLEGLSSERLQSVLEGFLAVASDWRTTLAETVEAAGPRQGAGASARTR